MIYWDTSALIKLYVPEPDSPYFLKLAAASGETIGSSAILTAEVLCAAYRKERFGELRPGGAAALVRRLMADCKSNRIVLIPYGDDVVAEVRDLVRLALRKTPAVMIRTLDAIHLASAKLGGATRMVATDARLRQAAALAGLAVLPPGREAR